MRAKIVQFFQEKQLSNVFLEDLFEVMNECEADFILLQEQLFMLCHQYDFSEPEKLIELFHDRETILIKSEEFDGSRRELAGFSDISLLGLGGMGEVRRVLDRDMNCYVAMKILHERLMKQAGNIERFHNEAKILAQLQHPNIPPIHRFGYMDDGRPYFVMREIEGRPFSDMLMSFHRDAATGTQGEALVYRFRHLIDIFRFICSAVGYAHHKGFIHRDLKPSNVMIGSFSEVLVVDWGLARNLLQDQEGEGTIEGTPAYMSPEQIKGAILDERSDVFSLGAILYEILTGTPPFFGTDGMSIIANRTTGSTIAPINTHTYSWNDLDIVAICMKALSVDSSERFSSAHHVETEIKEWLDGIKAQERGMKLVGKAEETKEREKYFLDEAQNRNIRLDELRASIPRHADQSEKVELWSLEDEVESLHHKALLQKSLREEFLQGALVHKPDLVHAHLGLVEHYIHDHKEAERVRNTTHVRLCERRIRTHLSSIPTKKSKPFHDYLKGDGYVELHTSEDDVHVELQRYREVSRRLILGEAISLGKTPIKRLELEHGSYMLTLSKEGFETIQYPILVERSKVWDSRHPKTKEPIRLLKYGSLSDNDCYVPGSWFIMGGDPGSASALPRKKCWLDSFVMKKFPVTNKEYLHFLNVLVEKGEQDLSLELVPRERSGKAGEQGPMIYGYDKEKGYHLCADADGDIWEEDYPVCFVDWSKAHRYAKFMEEETGAPWRLPTEFEWEKSARGVDGRVFPWGYYFEPSWACVREAAKGRPLPSVVDTFLLDKSPYGLRGMSGNMCDWTSSIYSKMGPKCSEKGIIMKGERGDERSYYSYRGGSWTSLGRHARLAHREAAFGPSLGGNLSFRLAYSIR